MSDSIERKRGRLLDWFSDKNGCAVAFSGGVDSAVVARAAGLALGDRAVAVTAVSASLAEGELDSARRIAGRIGIRHRVIRTDELARPEYVRNQADRCFHCKQELYETIWRLAPELDVDLIVNGANTDDLGDYRPGLQAARDHRVRSPLVDCGIDKEAVRQLARLWDLPVWNKPATPCLSSRIAYGEQVTPERLRMIDRAEQFLRSNGLEPCRVRYHRGDLARVEIDAERLPQVVGDPRLAAELVTRLKSFGFRFVTIDLEGFRSGSMNSLVQIGQRSSGAG